MARKQQQYPSDFTPDRARKPDSDDMHSSTIHQLALTPLSPAQDVQRRQNAQRAVTYVSLEAAKVGGVYGDLGPIGEVFLALGLIEKPAPNQQIADTGMRCPTCNSKPNTKCRSPKSGLPVGTHVARQRLAERVRAGQPDEILTEA